MGEKGDWSVDFHQKFDFPDALRLCRLIEEYEPYLVEDPVRDEQFLEDIPRLRKMTTCPLAAGEEWGQRWNFNPLLENHDIDYIRVTLPNVDYGERPIDYLPECLDFKQGKLYTNERPGLGVSLDLKLLKQIGEVTTPISRQVYKRPDGSLTHW